MFFETQNLSNALCVLSEALLERGVWTTRGKNAAGNKCLEFPGAVLIKINNPTNRYCFVPDRKWNKTLGWAESLWLATGSNNLSMPGSYVKNLYSFSDDGVYMRAGYGPRIRRFGDNFTKYQIGAGTMYRQYGDSHSGVGVDQLRFIVDKFKEDLGTREAVITIHDPMADDFDMGNGGGPILRTKDTPCTRSIHFMVVDGKMNCYVDMRSNDLIWGFSAVNVFNFTLMQEYVAKMVGVPVGVYYHKVDNLHIYESAYDLVKSIATYGRNAFCTDESYEYQNVFSSLPEFDAWITKLSKYEKGLRGADGDIPYSDEEALYKLQEFSEEPMFMDWAKVFYRRWIKKPIEFANPLLNRLFE